MLSPPAQAAVSDNVVLSSIEQSIGEGNGDTVFGLLKSIWSKVSITFDKVELLEAKIDTQTSMINDLTLATKNQTALAGGGCYYTLHTRREYLNGYKLRLSDGTSSKSCYIAYDADSNYWSGVLKAPLKDNVTVEIIDSSTGTSQGKLSTTASTTSGYATIDLDALMVSNVGPLLAANDALASSMYRDSYFTKNVSILQTVVDRLVEHDEHLQDFVKSSVDLEIAATNLDELWNDAGSVISIINSVAGEAFIKNSTTGQSIANTKSVLKAIGENTDAAVKCNSVSKFGNYLACSSLIQTATKKTKSVAGGSANSISGNILCISVTSGSRGNSYPIDGAPLQIRGYNGYNSTWGDYGETYVVNTRAISCRGSAGARKGAINYSLYNAATVGGTNGVYTRYNRDYSTVVQCDKIYYSYNAFHYLSPPTGTIEENSASTTIGVYKFADQVDVNSFGSESVTTHIIDGDRDLPSATITASTPSANSIITYIDLNE